MDNTEKKLSRVQNFITCSIILRNICLTLLAGFIIIGIRALCGEFDLDHMHILDIIIHYLYFISVLGYLCINIRIIFLYAKECKDRKKGIKDENQMAFKRIAGNVVILILCIVSCIIIMWREGSDRVVDWIVLQYGLIAWIAVIYVWQSIITRLGLKGKNSPSGDDEIRADSFYIPKLLGKIENDKLKDQIAHELYTYAVRAKFYKYGYYICSITALVSPTIVVILNSVSSETVIVKLGVSIFSGIAAIASGMLGIVKFKESWTRYRYNCEILKAEVAAYINRQGDYENSDGREQLFYKNVKAIINEEIYDWKKLRQENDS